MLKRELVKEVDAKFCKDCKWVIDAGFKPKCAYPPSLTESDAYFVNGLGEMQFCHHMRDDNWRLVTPCGKEARFWEARDAKA